MTAIVFGRDINMEDVDKEMKPFSDVPRCTVLW